MAMTTCQTRANAPQRPQPLLAPNTTLISPQPSDLTFRLGYLYSTDPIANVLVAEFDGGPKRRATHENSYSNNRRMFYTACTLYGSMREADNGYPVCQSVRPGLAWLYPQLNLDNTYDGSSHPSAVTKEGEGEWKHTIWTSREV